MKKQLIPLNKAFLIFFVISFILILPSTIGVTCFHNKQYIEGSCITEQNSIGLIGEKTSIYNTPPISNIFNSDEGERICEISNCSPSATLESIDYDGDGDMDYLEGANEWVSIVTNTNGNFEKQIVHNWLFHPDPGTSINCLVYGDITTGDFNNDGQQDFITGGVNGRIRIFINNDSQPGMPSFDNFSLAKFGQSAYGLDVADFNVDGWLDFAVSWATRPLGHSTISLFYNNGNLSFTQMDIYQLEPEYYIHELDVGDYDNDGDMDIIFTKNIYKWHGDWAINVIGAYYLLENKGDDSFNLERLIAERGRDLFFYIGLGFYFTVQLPIRHFFGLNRINPHITSDDFDEDGDIDFIVGDNSGMVEFFINDGAGNFESDGVIHRYGALSWGLTSGDFDDDGDVDFLVGALIKYRSDYGYVWLKQNQLFP